MKYGRQHASDAMPRHLHRGAPSLSLPGRRFMMSLCIFGTLIELEQYKRASCKIRHPRENGDPVWWTLLAVAGFRGALRLPGMTAG